MFRKGQKVVYPRHGAGKIVDKYKVEIDGEEKTYYKIDFYNSKINVSVPQDQCEELGLREPHNKKELKKLLRDLGKRVKITKSTAKELDSISKENLLSGKMEDAIELVNLLRSFAKKKEEENKNFSYSASQRLETVVNFIRSEVEQVLGKRAADKYELEYK